MCIYTMCLVACICWCLHRGMQWAGVWLLSTRLYACEVCVWLPACRCGVRLARYLKHPGPGSAGASKLVASLEPGSRRPGSCSRATGRSQPNRRYMTVYSRGSLSLPSVRRWHSTKMILCRMSSIRHSANHALPSAIPRHSVKYIFIFFPFFNQFFWFILHYVDLHVQFWHNYKSVCYNY